MAVLVADVLGGDRDTTVSGTVYEDLDQNGVRSDGENGLADRTIYLDLDRSGTLNTDAAGTLEPSAITNRDGDYSLGYLQPGAYRVALLNEPGWRAISPISLDVSVTAGHDTAADFFVFGGGAIEGAVWNDYNQDGERATDSSGRFVEPGLPGWTVFLDYNSDNVRQSDEPATATDEAGIYQFTDLAPGDYEVSVELPAGWEAAEGFDVRQSATVDAVSTRTLDFAFFSTVAGSLSGTVWNDLNNDGIRDQDASTGDYVEPGIPDWTVYVDINGSGELDTTPDGALEPFAITDATGHYSFASLPTGDYLLAQVFPAGWQTSEEIDAVQSISVEAGVSTVANDFAAFTVQNGSISGIAWNDLNRNGVRDTDALGVASEPGLAGWTIFLDLDGNGVAGASEPQTTTDSAGAYQFLDLQIGEYEVIQVVPTGWEVASLHSENYSVRVYSGLDTRCPDFANYDAALAPPASVSGVVWDDQDGNGIRNYDAGADRFLEPGLAGWTVFLDANRNHLLDAGEQQVTTDADGKYTLSAVPIGTALIGEVLLTGWNATAPVSGFRAMTVRSGQEYAGVDFGNAPLRDSTIRGVVFHDRNPDGQRSSGEQGISGISVYLDLNNNGVWDSAEPVTQTSSDLFYTPDINEAGEYAFTHLAQGTYTVRVALPDVLSATPLAERTHIVEIASAQIRDHVDTAAVYRASEIRGVKFRDLDGDHARDLDEPTVAGAKVYIDYDRDGVHDADEPSTITDENGVYTFVGLTEGAYVVRSDVSAGYLPSYPTTTGGVLWPEGTSHAAVGDVSPRSITTVLAQGETFVEHVSLTLPTSGALTNLVDVFLLFDDTGSFTNNSPIVRGAFPEIISRLEASLPGIDLGFGVGRLEEYGGYAYEYATGRPFILNQPIVAASTPGYQAAIQAALDRTTPGYGGDEPETDIEALYQLVTGAGFDGNNNGSVLDSGPAGLSSTQLDPGDSGDVPSFASFRADLAANVLPAAGNVGGGGFRSGSLPIVLLATDTGFAFQPKGEAVVTGAGGVSVPVSDLVGTSRPDTPFNSGAGLQQTVTALNALGALVIGLGTNSEANLDPRQGLEALSKLTGAVNKSATTIDNGTIDSIAPGDPLYFEIASGFSTSVANGVVNAIQNAVTQIAVDIDVIASDPRVRIVNRSGPAPGVAAGQTAGFDIEFIGDGRPHRFDLQFVRQGTNVVLGSIPVVIGTPIPGDGYEFEDLELGEIELESDFGEYQGSTPPNHSPLVTSDAYAISEDQTLTVAADLGVLSNDTDQDGDTLTAQLVTDVAHGSLTLHRDGSFVYSPNANYAGSDSFSYRANDGTVNSEVIQVPIDVQAVNDAPAATSEHFNVLEDDTLTISYDLGVLANDTDVDGDALAAQLVTDVAHGSLTLNRDGSFIYSPHANYAGGDSFSYRANDGTVDSDVIQVSIDVQAVNDVPAALADQYSTRSGETLTVSASQGVLANDTDVDHDALTAQLATSPTQGSLTLNADGSFTYSPQAGYAGADSFTYQTSDGSSTSTPMLVLLIVQPVVGAVKFHVVDASARAMFNYDAAGQLSAQRDLAARDESQRGITSNIDGSRIWTLDANGVVFVYDSAGQLLGSWEAKGNGRPTGIATDGRSIWIVDADSDRVNYYAMAATRLAGSASPNLKLKLDRANGDAADITTDGRFLWIVNDTPTIDRVFKYTIGGKRLGSWQIDAANSRPTGIAIDPHSVDDIWIVDSLTDAVYRYAHAAKRTSGSPSASDMFLLDAANKNPQGIVDPWVVNESSTFGRSPNDSISAGSKLDNPLSTLWAGSVDEVHSDAKSSPTTTRMRTILTGSPRESFHDAVMAQIGSRGKSEMTGRIDRSVSGERGSSIDELIESLVPHSSEL
jgi:VCBS repeat-containing protein